MTVGKDFIYVTQCKDDLFMWLDEPSFVDNHWVGKQPYVNSVMQNKVETIVNTLGISEIDEYELITLNNE